MAPLNLGPRWGGGLGPRQGGQVNQWRPHAVGVRAILEDVVMEAEVMASQQGQDVGQQSVRKGATLSPCRRQGN